MKKILFTVFIATLFVGCGIKKTIVDRVPYASKADLTHVYVVENRKDKWKCYKDIVELLKERGYHATYGKSDNVPENATAIITYVDRWKIGGWATSMYLAQINLIIRNPQDNYPIASSTYLNVEGIGTHFQKDIIETGLDALLEKLKEKKK